MGREGSSSHHNASNYQDTKSKSGNVFTQGGDYLSPCFELNTASKKQSWEKQTSTWLTCFSLLSPRCFPPASRGCCGTCTGCDLRVCSRLQSHPSASPQVSYPALCISANLLAVCKQTKGRNELSWNWLGCLSCGTASFLPVCPGPPHEFLRGAQRALRALPGE